MTATPPAGLLAMLTGGAPLPLPSIPCAYCVGDKYATLATRDQLDEPNNAATMVAGTPVCVDHATTAVERLDRGQIADQIGRLADAVQELTAVHEDVRRSIATVGRL